MSLTEKDYDMPHEKTWCPGCGHFTVQKILRQAIAELEIPNEHLVFVSGIGQAAKLPQYTKGNMFNGLHGRALPAAMAIKACNPNLTVIVDSGDGCSYGEGSNHFLAQMARNSDIVQIVHNNMSPLIHLLWPLPWGQHLLPVFLRGIWYKPRKSLNKP